MAKAIQVCTKCGAMEWGHTGPADHYECVACHRVRVEAEAVVRGKGGE